ncbi:flagellar basal body P-ring biosynthesis protein FlgA [Actinomyces bovis]|uniref:Flagellar basal body P-ring biosynthesis protein FlgA n=1 Tax=Actinomyces bovis TaxID=1658 RepID=A0ABY1VNF2_9ACTO|nr:SAF domain-containing protein [Actinomyces bovis]SPT53621.1 flagellar basal body P-ring biosynthesis protein FlgA [Actinomyces bovis]VEG55673.1 flagellar basal body P-ring biosynthesis protein FlgA [Actinomyces israelii]
MLAVLAVLLIVGGALVAGLLATRLDQRKEMLVAANTIKAGHVIELSDLASASVSANVNSLIPAEKVNEIVGQTARVEVTQGEFLASTQILASPAVKDGTTLTGLSLAVGRFPAGGLRPGDVVTLVNVKDGSTAVTSAQILEAVPTSGNANEWTSGSVISLLVHKDDSAKVARLGAEESIAIAVTATGHAIGDF